MTAVPPVRERRKAPEHSRIGGAALYTAPLDGGLHEVARQIGVRSRHTPAENVRPQTVLQHSAHRNRMAHTVRAAVRVGGLMALDIVGISIVVELLRRTHEITFSRGMDLWWRLDTVVGATPIQWIAALCTGIFLAGAYNGGDARRDPNRLARGIGLGLLIAVWQALWGSFMFLAWSTALTAASFTVVLVLLRFAADQLVQHVFPQVREKSTILLIGTHEEIELARQAGEDNGGWSPAACLDPTVSHREHSGRMSSYGIDDLPVAIAAHAIDTILLCGHLEDRVLTHVVIAAEAAGCRVLSPSRTFSLANLAPSVIWRDGAPMIQLTRPGLHGRDLIFKRLFDIAVASTALLIASPVMLVVAILVRLSSPGPIIFRQRRVGYAGSTFTILKFRTMYRDAEARLASLQENSVYRDGKLFKMSSDPRITPLGRWLRKTSLDELPQLFNVVTGSMSLVGPRPPLPQEVVLYDDEEFIRFGMKPGITGPWQVSGRNRVTSFSEVLRIESAYFSGWTIWRDFRILAQTLPAVLKMDGAQ